MAKIFGDSTAIERIQSARGQLLSEYVDYLNGIDESDPTAWATVVKTAREAGLDKDTLCHELSCAWSTVLRWEAGQTVPGPFARKSIKARLVELLQAMLLEQRTPIAAE
jgi:DNA-binding transcriptional regulator YiaG